MSERPSRFRTFLGNMRRATRIALGMGTGVPQASSFELQYPVLIPLRAMYAKIASSTNYLQTYRLLKEVDPELAEKRLISLATVLAMKPEVLILDEPSTGLDEDTVERLTEILRSSDLTYLIASHNSDFLSKTTDIVYRLDRGKLARPAKLI